MAHPVGASGGSHVPLGGGRGGIMNPRTVLSYAWKVPVCGLAFLAGTILGSMLAGAMGMQTPSMPPGTDPARAVRT